MSLLRPVVRLFTPIVILLGLAASGFAQERLRKEAAVFEGGQINGPDTPSRPLPTSFGLRLPRAREVGLGGLSAEEHGRLGPVGPKQRIGVHRTLPDGTQSNGTWSTVADGRRIWRLSIRSSAA